MAEWPVAFHRQFILDHLLIAVVDTLSREFVDTRLLQTSLLAGWHAAVRSAVNMFICARIATQIGSVSIVQSDEKSIAALRGLALLVRLFCIPYRSVWPQ